VRDDMSLARVIRQIGAITEVAFEKSWIHFGTRFDQSTYEVGSCSMMITHTLIVFVHDRGSRDSLDRYSLKVQSRRKNLRRKLAVARIKPTNLLEQITADRKTCALNSRPMALPLPKHHCEPSTAQGSERTLLIMFDGKVAYFRVEIFFYPLCHRFKAIRGSEAMALGK